MPNEVPMVTTCPLCLAPDEVESMVTVEIVRAIPKGRAAILICRNCAVAVIEAARKVDPPLLDWETVDPTGNLDPWHESESALADPLHPFSEAMTETQAESAQLHEGEAYPCPPGCELQLWGVEHTHTRKEYDDGKATD